MNAKKWSVISIPAVAVYALIVAAFPVTAQVVEFNFRGQVTSKADSTGFLGAGFEPGSEFTGRISFDVRDAQSDAYPDDPSIGLYSFPYSAPFTLDFAAGAHAFTGYWGRVETQDTPSSGPGADHLEYGAMLKSYDGFNLAPTGGGCGLALHRVTPPLDALPNDGLPTTAPRLSDFDDATIAIYATDASSGLDFRVYGVVTEITPIPEPEPAALLLGGIAALLMLRRMPGAPTPEATSAGMKGQLLHEGAVKN